MIHIPNDDVRELIAILDGGIAEVERLRQVEQDLNKAIIILFDASLDWYEFVSEKDTSLVYKVVGEAKRGVTNGRPS